MNADTIVRVLDMVEEEADKRELDAGRGGLMDDGGARRLREQAHFYRMGMAKELPKEWEKYELQIDPEYQEYLRLDAKFGKVKGR